jgi:hypothetical protein
METHNSFNVYKNASARGKMKDSEGDSVLFSPTERREDRRTCLEVSDYPSMKFTNGRSWQRIGDGTQSQGLKSADEQVLNLSHRSNPEAHLALY